MYKHIAFILIILSGALFYFVIKSIVDYNNSPHKQENDSDAFEFEPDVVEAVLID